MTASGSYRAATPAASPALARSTKRRVRSSGSRAFSLTVMPLVLCPPNQKSNRCFGSKLESAVVELRQLEYFVAVVEEGNFTRAAERVHISQSGISAQVRRLEKQLGAALIDRSGRTATLTPAGA